MKNEMSLKERAEAIARNMMNTASSFREESNEEVAMIFGFSKGDEFRIVPAVVIPSSSKEDMLLKVRNMANEMQADLVFSVSEAWMSMNPLGGRPSQDPNRMEAIVVSASGPGVRLVLTRQIYADGSLGDVKTSWQVEEGRFTNLSGKEMMN